MIKEIEVFKSDAKRFGFISWLTIFWNILISAGFEAVLLYRIQNFLERKRLIQFAKIISRINLSRNGIEFVIGSKIAQGLVVRHPVGVVIGKSVIAGENLTILSSVVLGQKNIGLENYNDGNPTIGRNVIIGAHAVILGPVKIADGVIIRANSVVLEDKP